jgi:hypothetical protein
MPKKTEKKISELDTTLDSTYSAKNPKFDEIIQPTTKSNTLSYSLISEHEDRKAYHIENYCLELLRNKEWSMQLDTQDYKILLKEGSIFHESLPVAMSYIDFGMQIQAREILEILYNPQERMAWDNKIKFMKILKKPSESKSIVYYIYEFPMKNREFIIKVITSSSTDITNIISYSCECEEIPHSSTCAPARTLFGFCTIIEKSDTTLILMAKQEDLNIGIYPGLLGNMSTQFTIWTQNFRNAVLSYHMRELS